MVLLRVEVWYLIYLMNDDNIMYLFRTMRKTPQNTQFASNKER